MDMLALTIAGLWGQWFGPILQLVIGLGLVIFIHELGHFLVARWVGIQVEKFALGFGPRLFGIKRGETDYCVNIFPIGGYVKMLDQEDLAPFKKDRSELDPRSYEAKSVGARFAVIAAGVVMNVILAALLFVVVGLAGMDFPAPTIGGVEAGYPASEVVFSWQPAGAGAQADTAPSTQQAMKPGLQPGDVVLEIDGKDVTRFTDLMMKSILAFDGDETFQMVVRRVDQAGKEWIGTGTLGVKRAPDGKFFMFGIAPADDTAFGEVSDAMADTVFRPGDRLVAIAGQSIKHNWQIRAVEKGLTGQVVTVTIERAGEEAGAIERIDLPIQPAISTSPKTIWLADGQRAKLVDVETKDDQILYQAQLADGSEKLLKFEQLAGGGIVEQLDILGLIPRLKVAMVTKGSRADQAGIQPGDIVVGYGDHGAVTLQQFFDISAKVVETGTEIVVLRNGKPQTLKVVPKLRPVAGKEEKKAMVGIVNGIDLAHTVVAGIREGSPAQKAGIMPDDVIEAVNGEQVGTWVDVLGALRGLAGQEVTIAYRRNMNQRTAEIGVLNEAIFAASDYDVRLFSTEVFKPLTVTIHKPNPIHAVAWGAEETWDFIIRTYATLRALARRTVSTETLSGPVGIAMIMVEVGRRQSIIEFVYFLAFISASIAVINFLPIPVVDGGHAVFLLIEKLRGKPLPTKVMEITQFVGLGLLGVVFVLLTWQDLARWWGGLW